MAEDVFKIEDAKPEDVVALRTIVRDAWLELYPNEAYGITAEDISAIDWYAPKEIEKRKREITEMEDTVHTWVVRNSGNEAVGFCKARKADERGEIKGMYIAKELQGKGLGKGLMQKAFEWLGDVDVRLKVVAYNLNAIEFYKKMGFKETGNKVSYDGTLLPNGKDIPRIEMMKLRN